MTYISVDERRAAFVDAAVDLIASEGLAKATTRRIAERAGAPLGALHYCFRNKNELMELMAQRGAETISTALDDIDPARGVEATVRESVDAYWAWVRDNVGLQVALFELGLWMIRNRREEMYSTWNQFGIIQLAEMLDRAAEVDGVPLAHPAGDLAHFLFHRIDALSLEYAASPDEACERQAAMLADSLVVLALPPSGSTAKAKPKPKSKAKPRTKAAASA